MTYDEYRNWLMLADSDPTAMLTVAQYLIEPLNWGEINAYGEDLNDVVERAMLLLHRCANSDPGDDGVHRGRAGKLMADIYYYPVYHIVNLGEAAKWYEWAAVELRHAPVEEIHDALLQAIRCRLYSREEQAAVALIEKLQKVTGSMDGWCEFAQYGFEHDHVDSANALMNHLFQEENMATIFMCARMIVPDRPGVEPAAKDLLHGCISRLIDKFEAEGDAAIEYFSVVAWYLYTQHQKDFIGSKQYRDLIRGAKNTRNVWCNYYCGKMMLHELLLMQESDKPEAADAADTARDLMQNCMHFASDFGCRPAMTAFLETVKAFTPDDTKTIAQYTEIVKAFDAAASRE